MRRLYTLLLLSAFATACGPRDVAEAERRGDVAWLGENPTAESTAALGRLADADTKARSAVEARAGRDPSVYVAAWAAILRKAEWGTTTMRSGLGDPTRSELAAAALPRRDDRVIPFVTDLENAVIRLSSGKRGSVIAGVLASLGTPARAAVERRLVDPKTRGAMCDGIATPESSPEAKAALLAVPLDARDHFSCVTAAVAIATTDDAVLGWIAVRAEPGLLGVAAKSTLPCPRLAAIWKKALAERPATDQGAMAVPLTESLGRCAPAIDPVLGELLTKAPRARATIIQAIDPYSDDLKTMKETCLAIKAGAVKGESSPVRERADDALNRGCAFVKLDPQPPR